MLMNRKAKTVNVLEGPMTESCAEFPARHVFIKCPECRRVIDEARLHDNLEVCPRCGKHFRVSGRDRMHMTIDEGTFEEWDASLAPEDFLSFPGYADQAQERERTFGRARCRCVRQGQNLRLRYGALLYGRQLYDGLDGFRGGREDLPHI